MNVILLIFDTLRKDCVNILGSPPWGRIKTPNLDEFAGQSIIFKECYPESLPTLPARRAIYTGCRVYPFRDNANQKGDFKGSPGWGPILEERETLSEVLQYNGYTTALISDLPHMFKPSKNFHRGFNQWEWVRGYEVDQYRSGPLPSEEDIDRFMPKEIQNNIYRNFLSQCLMNIQDVKSEEDYSIARVMRKAVKWLEQNKEKDKKFLTIEAWSPHEPWFVPEHYRDIYNSGDYPQQVLSLYCDTSDISYDIIEGTRANYSGMVTMCDRWFGYLIESIKAMNMLDNTLILVTSDHGHSIGDNNFLGKRGYPSSPETFDSFIFLWHPDNPAGRGTISDMMVQHTDIYPTILNILKIEPRVAEQEYKWSAMYEILLGASAKNAKAGKKELELDGKPFFRNFLEGNRDFRDHVTIGWGGAVTVINARWWFNCRVNGKGAFLYDRKSRDPFGTNIAGDNEAVVKELFKIALDDAGGQFPEYLIRLADNEKDAPGCSALVAL